jgi:hypothetical protein
MKSSFRTAQPGKLNTPWDIAYRKPPLKRLSRLDNKIMELERGVTYFIEKIEKLGGETLYSCEGHPGNFYIMFDLPYETTLKLANHCTFSVIEVCYNFKHHNVKNRWVLRLMPHADKVKDALLRTLAIEWEKVKV